MTSCEKPIWLVTFSSSPINLTSDEKRYAACDFVELLSFFSKEALKNIQSIEKTTEKVTYFY